MNTICYIYPLRLVQTLYSSSRAFDGAFSVSHRGPHDKFAVLTELSPELRCIAIAVMQSKKTPIQHLDVDDTLGSLWANFSPSHGPHGLLKYH